MSKQDDKRKNGDGSPQNKKVMITRPNLQTVSIRIRGIEPLVQHKFGAKARDIMIRTQEAGSTAKTKKVREPKDFDACCDNATHRLPNGGYGIPASAFRKAMISACRTCGFKMTLARLSVRVIADGCDPSDGTQLVKITKGKPHRYDAAVRNSDGSADIRARPMFDPGWEATVRVQYDAGMFTIDDIANLMLRVGTQVGIGEAGMCVKCGKAPVEHYATCERCREQFRRDRMMYDQKHKQAAATA